MNSSKMTLAILLIWLFIFLTTEFELLSILRICIYQRISNSVDFMNKMVGGVYYLKMMGKLLNRRLRSLKYLPLFKKDEGLL